MRLLDEIRESLAIAWAAVRANKLRSGLTTLGVVIGILTVTLMGTANFCPPLPTTFNVASSFGGLGSGMRIVIGTVAAARPSFVLPTSTHI